MSEFSSRTELILGSDGVSRLSSARVLIFGVGGVGGYAAEALARSGVGSLTLVDNDKISESNINRQIIALRSTVGRLKTEVMAERIRDINPEACVVSLPIFYTAENADAFDYSEYDFIIDAIDTVSSKLLIIERAISAGVPVISSMGAGNKLDPASFRICDIYETSVCPLARVMRYELRRRGIQKLPVVFSDEPPRTMSTPENGKSCNGSTRPVPGSCAFVPSAAGLVLAGYVVRQLAGV